MAVFPASDLLVFAFETPIMPLVGSCAIAPQRDDHDGLGETRLPFVGIGPQDWAFRPWYGIIPGGHPISGNALAERRINGSAVEAFMDWFISS